MEKLKLVAGVALLLGALGLWALVLVLYAQVQAANVVTFARSDGVGATLRAGLLFRDPLSATLVWMGLALLGATALFLRRPSLLSPLAPLGVFLVGVVAALLLNRAGERPAAHFSGAQLELVEAALRHDAARAREVLARGLAIDAASDRPFDGTSPLVYAAQRGDTAAVRLLLELGADPEARPRNGAPCALDVAVGAPTEALLEVLVAHTRRPVAWGPWAHDVVFEVPPRGAAKLRRLLDAGVPVDFRNGSHETLLTSAAGENAPELVALLLERGADVHVLSALLHSPANEVQRALEDGAPRLHDDARRIKALLEQHGARFPVPTVRELKQKLEGRRPTTAEGWARLDEFGEPRP